MGCKTCKNDDTKTKIIKNVIHLLARGDTVFSMSKIASESGVSKSTLYYFFKNKKDLFHSVLYWIFDEMSYSFDKIKQKNISADKKLREIMHKFVEYTLKETSVTHFVFQQMFSHDRKEMQKIFSMREEKISYFRNCLEEGVEQGIFRDMNIDLTVDIIDGFLAAQGLRNIFPCPSEFNISDPYKLCDEFISLLLSEKK